MLLHQNMFDIKKCDAGYWILDTGYLSLDPGCWLQIAGSRMPVYTTDLVE